MNGKLTEALDAWAWLTERQSLSVEWHGPVYGDDDEPVEWRVYRESGSINDREWDVVGAGETALEAVLAARAALSQEGEGEEGNSSSVANSAGALASERSPGAALRKSEGEP